MQKWEYCRVQAWGENIRASHPAAGFYTNDGKQPVATTEMEMLNKMGELGWELLELQLNPYYFKRPKQ